MKLVTCPSCNGFHSITNPEVMFIRCPTCHTMVFPACEGPSVLVAHGCETISQQIGAVLVQSGYYPLHATNGNLTIKILDTQLPKGLILDVAMEEVPAFQIIDYVRRTPSLHDLLIVLVASVYSYSAYKRKPKSLYGADDYVEQHHIHDLLPEKLSNLAALPPHTKTGCISNNISKEPQQEIPHSAQQVTALAHSIVCDIALYYQDEIEATVKHGHRKHLASALDEGRRLLSNVVSKNHLVNWDPIQEAFNNLLETLRAK